MKAVILAGGLGTRISEESAVRPKPMVEIGGRPILWHILKIYATHGIHDFIICLGYKGFMIKEYFADYFLHTSDVTFDLAENKMTVHQNSSEPWRVTLIDTGEGTQTGGRLKRLAPYLDEDFCFTYGDGLADIDITALIAFHRSHGCFATVTAVQPQSRFGLLDFEGDVITAFREKPQGQAGWVSGGFFVLSPRVLDFIDGDLTIWERGPVTHLVNQRQLRAYRHTGFWYPMDTQRDHIYLEDLWEKGAAPWKVWE